MTPEFLEACIAGDLDSAAQISGFVVPPAWLEVKWLMELRLKQMRENPVLVDWLLRAVILRETGAMIGHIGFHSLPGPDYLKSYTPNGVEFGYSIFPAYRRHGYASEAVEALMAWATGEHAVPNFILSISPTNEPSLRLAQKFGFRKISTVFDEEEGVEDIFLLET